MPKARIEASTDDRCEYETFSRDIDRKCVAIVARPGARGPVHLLARADAFAKTLADPDPAGTVHGLLIGAAVLGVPALIHSDWCFRALETPVLGLGTVFGNGCRDAGGSCL